VGTWGPGIFSDDLAADVRDDYRDAIGDGMSGAEATTHVLSAHADALADQESASVVWLALAVAQSHAGRLEDQVRVRAIEIIDGGLDLQRWVDDPKLQRRRAAVLDKVRAELTGPQRPPRRVARPVRSVWPWDPGTVVSFRRSDGRFLLLRVVATAGEQGVGGGRYGISELVDWIDERLPAPADVDALPSVRPRDWSATDGHPRLHGITILGQPELDRFAPFVEGEPPEVSRRVPQHFLIRAAELEEIAAKRFGLG
jgi:hypothetical protein